MLEAVIKGISVQLLCIIHSLRGPFNFFGRTIDKTDTNLEGVEIASANVRAQVADIPT